MINKSTKLPLGREPPDAMSLCYADIEPPRFARQTEPPLCRQSLRYADRASAIHGKRASTIQHSFFLNLGFYEWWKLLTIFFWCRGIRILQKIRVVHWLSWLETYMDSFKVVYKIYIKTFNISYAERKILGEMFLQISFFLRKKCFKF